MRYRSLSMTDNNFDKIKKLIKIIGGKVIIIEDGKPTMVIINVDEYFGLENKSGLLKSNSFETELTEKINKEINIWKDKQGERRLKQLEMENNFRKESDSKNENDKNNDEIIVEKL